MSTKGFSAKQMVTVTKRTAWANYKLMGRSNFAGPDTRSDEEFYTGESILQSCATQTCNMQSCATEDGTDATQVEFGADDPYMETCVDEINCDDDQNKFKISDVEAWMRMCDADEVDTGATDMESCVIEEVEAKKGNSETYIDEVADYKPLSGKDLVAIDPNMSDLLYCVNSDTHEQTTFRYTQDTRRKETKAKECRDYVQERKQEVIDGKRVVEWEAELSAYNRKTTDFERFKAYVEKKNEMNRRLSPVYNEYIFRKLKLGSYMRRQITEARLLKQFEKLFGSGTETIVAVGDWDQRQHCRLKEPVKGKGLQDGVSEGGLRRVPGR